MWTMWDAPSDRDYLEQFNPPEPEAEDPENVPDDPLLEEPREGQCGCGHSEADAICPF